MALRWEWTDSTRLNISQFFIYYYWMLIQSNLWMNFESVADVRQGSAWLPWSSLHLECEMKMNKRNNLCLKKFTLTPIHGCNCCFVSSFRLSISSIQACDCHSSVVAWLSHSSSIESVQFCAPQKPVPYKRWRADLQVNLVTGCQFSTWGPDGLGSVRTIEPEELYRNYHKLFPLR